jgi:hypothetical protein
MHRRCAVAARQVPFHFICLLHLANEKCLTVRAI